MSIQKDYLARVYAGVLGKIIGVYLGRPFEGWWNDKIERELGEVWYYINDKPAVAHPHKPLLVVTDDDISGTFTFLRALPDYGNTLKLTAQQIGQSWLNYIIEKRTILWWGGLGNSTEHTAYLRLKNGIPAPDSGSIATNGKVVAEQIGSQIFIDGWAMVAPGDPALAADLAKRASSVSHDGEAIYGAQVIAAMESLAFVESDINKLLDCGLSVIPQDSVIATLIRDVREWHANDGDWRKTFKRIEKKYGYDKYGGNCHMVPNHAVIILALLYGDDKDPGLAFQKSLMIANTAGWDTDCNSANVGCLNGIRFGLEAIDRGPDWRGPVADRLYLPTADGGSAITDAVQTALSVVNVGRALAGKKPLAPKNGARYHFDLPGSVQGFMVEEGTDSAAAQLSNVAGHSKHGSRSLCLTYQHVTQTQSAHVATATFIPPEAIPIAHYQLLACPTLYSGQMVHARVEADKKNDTSVTVSLYIRTYGEGDVLKRIYGPNQTLKPSKLAKLEWEIPDTDGEPIAEIGIEVSSNIPADGRVYLDELTWSGEPTTIFKRPSQESSLWRRAFVDGIDQYDRWWNEAFRVVQNSGTGLLIQGTRDWKNYRVSSSITPHLCQRFGVAARVQGMVRYYALLLCADGKARLVKALDGETVLAEVNYKWQLGKAYDLILEVSGKRIIGSINGKMLFDLRDDDRPLQEGAIALVITEGRAATEAVMVESGGV